MADTPYIGFSNETLNAQPEMKVGDVVPCADCAEGQHIVFGAGSLLFYHCGRKALLAGVNGRSVIGVKADMKGTVR